MFGGGSAREVDEAHPVSKVITLMKDMLAQLDKEGKEDEETYETMGCWCETNDREKTKAIADAEARIASLGSLIEELTGKSSKLNTEIAKLNEEIAENENSLNAAQALRTKQLAEFNAEEKDMLASITSLKSAVVTLRKHAALLEEVITARQMKALESFAQAPDAYFQPASATSLVQQPQSGAIFGILSQMKEEFETNLANSQKEEGANQRAFEDLKASKTSEIAAGKTSAEQKTQELADTDMKNAESKEDKENTEETLAADTKFLADVKANCAGFDAEYAERTKTRQLEIQAVNAAMEFLTSDEA